MIRERRVILGLMGAASVSLAIVPFLLRAEDPELALRREQIEQMSQAERERIQRNYQQFESITNSERQYLRDFAAALAVDRANNHGRLSETMRIYANWLKTVTPHQRDELQQESEPVKRIAMIREIVESQRNERVETRMGGRIEEFLGPIPDLNRKDLAAILEIIDRKTPLFARSAQDLEGYEGVRRSLKLFELMARQNRTINELLSDTTTRQLLEAVTDEQTRRELESLPETERMMPESRARRLKFGLAIQKAVFTELDREYRRRELSQQNLEKFFGKLTPDEQDELLALAPEEFRRELRGQFVESEWTKSPITISAIRQFFRPQRPGDRQPGGGPRRDNRDGRSRPPDRRSPGTP